MQARLGEERHARALRRDVGGGMLSGIHLPAYMLTAETLADGACCQADITLPATE